MEKGNKKKRPLKLIARDYFNYLGRHLPQQCASDEFYFLPRSEGAIQNLHLLDDLAPEKIQGHLAYVQDLLREISAEERADLEEEIDRLMLKQSMGSFIREFKDREVWRNDPTLYVKIPLFATEQVISQRDLIPEQLKEKFSLLFDQIPSSLSLALKTLLFPSEIALKVAINITEDAIHFYDRDIRGLIEERIGRNRELLAKIKRVLEAWERYKRALLQRPLRDSFAIGEDGLNKILVSLSYPKSPGEILEIARYARQKTQDRLCELAGKIDTRKAWTHIIYEGLPAPSPLGDVLRLYREEVEKLRCFFDSQDIMSFPPGEKVIVLETPSYLQSLRATASYKAPLTGRNKGYGQFYITPGKEDLELISRHSPYLSAHETYPGHHILDHIRIHHSNPIRRQIESPLFYEGWACYTEQLLDELGYVRNPRQQLIGLKRQLWRSIRAELDVRLQIGEITLDRAAEKIEALGFSPQRAERQVRRFCLTPGYQLCYFMGSHEIISLRGQFSSKMGIKHFHDTLLGGGEIPSHLVERRLEASLD
ncbi:MAG: DUF885 family protein, partial [Desulfatiglandales bacterium]|nr:DUF885 family protein [Desulfatiglandales bacterium]